MKHIKLQATRCALMLCASLWLSYNAHAQTITTYADTGSPGYTGDGGAALSADIDGGWGLAADTSGNIYIADQNNSVVRKITTGGIITTVAGDGSYGFGGDGGAATAAQLGGPTAMAVDRAGNLYIADPNNMRVRKVTPAGVITTFAGDGSSGFGGDGGQATAASLFLPFAVATDRAGNVYIADAFNHRIRKVTTAGIITTYAGNGSAGYSGDGGPATAARIDSAFSLAIDTAGNLFFGSTNFTIRKITLSGTISTVAGNATAGATGDGGPATAAEISYAFALAVDQPGNIYISDMYNNKIRKVNLSGTIDNFAGTGTASYSGDGGPATAADVDNPVGVAVDRAGNVYFADINNFRVRVVSGCPIPVVPAITGASTICRGATTTLSDAAAGGNWSSSNPSVASVNAAGMVSGISGGSVTITYIVTNTCGADTATQAIAVNPFAGVVTGVDSLCLGDTSVLHNSVSGGTWSSTNNTVATVSATGTVKGIASGSTVIRYIMNSTCGADTVFHPLRVRTHASCAAGIGNHEVTAAGLKAYPNPTTGTFTLSLASPVNEAVEITITNILGQKVKEFTIITNNETAMQPYLPSGVYLISALTNGERITTKLIVE